MNNIKDVSLDSLAIASISSGIPIVAGLGDKWYIGLILIAVGIGLSFTKYFLREV